MVGGGELFLEVFMLHSVLFEMVYVVRARRIMDRIKPAELYVLRLSEWKGIVELWQILDHTVYGRPYSSALLG